MNLEPSIPRQSNLPKDIDDEINHIVKFSIAKTIRRIMSCGIPSDEDMLQPCESTFTTSVSNRVYDIPVREDVRNDELLGNLIALKRQYWDRASTQVNSTRQVPGNLIPRFLMRFYDYSANDAEPLHAAILKRHNIGYSSTFCSKISFVLTADYKLKKTYFIIAVPVKDALPSIVKLHSEFISNPNFRKNCSIFQDELFNNTKYYKIYMYCYFGDVFDDESINFIFYEVLLSLLEHCNQDLSFFPLIVDHQKNNKSDAHALGCIVQKTNSKYNMFMYDPHGNANPFPNFLKNCLDLSQATLKKDLFSIYQEEVSCPINFQGKWKDTIGYCAMYRHLWFECVLHTMKNINKYNEKIKNSTNNNLQLKPIDIDMIDWIYKVSDYLNKIDDVVEIIYHPFDNIADETERRLKIKQEIVMLYVSSLIQDYTTFFPQDSLLVNKLLSDEFKSQGSGYVDVPTIYSTFSDNYSRNKKIQGRGNRYNQLFTTQPTKTNLKQFLFKKDQDKPLQNNILPYKSYDELGINDSAQIDEERSIENYILKTVTENKIDSYCTSNSDCDTQMFDMICDKIDDNTDGLCIPAKKRVMETCQSNNECLSNNCNSNVCRMEQYSDKSIDRTKYIDNLDVLQLEKYRNSNSNSKLKNITQKLSNFSLTDKLYQKQPRYHFDYLENPEETAKERNWDEREWDVYYNYDPSNNYTLDDIDNLTNAYEDAKKLRKPNIS
jgi:hypothetical protein